MYRKWASFVPDSRAHRHAYVHRLDLHTNLMKERMVTSDVTDRTFESHDRFTQSCAYCNQDAEFMVTGPLNGILTWSSWLVCLYKWDTEWTLIGPLNWILTWSIVDLCALYNWDREWMVTGPLNWILIWSSWLVCSLQLRQRMDGDRPFKLNTHLK